jgi:hypothetical protein
MKKHVTVDDEGSENEDGDEGPKKGGKRRWGRLHRNSQVVRIVVQTRTTITRRMVAKKGRAKFRLIRSPRDRLV